MKRDKVSDLLKRGEEAIRGGNGPALRRELMRLNLAEVPHASRLPLANLCRRVGLISMGLGILAPKIKATQLGTQSASPAELAEYAVLLERIGALQEAVWTLDRVDAEKFPQALLYRAFCFFSSWNHNDAIPYLYRYLEAPITAYAKLIGKLNLSAALSVGGHYHEAREVAEACSAEARDGEHWRLYANSLEMRAEIALHTNQLEIARTYLDEASRILSAHQSFDQLFVMKWQAWLQDRLAHETTKLQVFRATALQRGEWESVREADLFSLHVRGDEERLDHLVFGTPGSGYQARIERILGRTSSSDSYRWGQSGGPTLDIASGQAHGLESVLPLGKKIHQLLECLSRDFYRPSQLGQVFAKLYPNEYFDISTSPDRVHQTVRRTRQWLRDSRIPLSIKEAGGAYSLSFDAPCSLIVSRQRPQIDGYNARLALLEAHFKPGYQFKAEDANSVLGLKSSTLRNFLKWAHGEGKISKQGGSKATRYSLHHKRAA